MKDKIGVIGAGFVGMQVIRWFECPFYSKNKGSFEDVDRQDIIFLCLPTPNNKKGFDISALIENLNKLTGKKKIVIKSTVLPNTTSTLAQKYPQHKFFFNPEFLTARSAEHDFLNADRQIVGFVNKKDKGLAKHILDILPDAPHKRLCSASEAEMIKLYNNCYLATRIIFANQMYDYCKIKGISYNEVIKSIKADPRIGKTHWDIWQDGFRGYAGACFPKDMKATGIDSKSPLIRLADKLNDKYIKQR